MFLQFFRTNLKVLLTILVGILLVWASFEHHNYENQLLVHNKIPNWHGITPSITSKAEVVNLYGNPALEYRCSLTTWGVTTEVEKALKVLKCFPFNLTYEYPNENKPDFHTLRHKIHFNTNEVVDYIVEFAVLSLRTNVFRYKDLFHFMVNQNFLHSQCAIFLLMGFFIVNKVL